MHFYIYGKYIYFSFTFSPALLVDTIMLIDHWTDSIVFDPLMVRERKRMFTSLVKNM